jgi:hypothetical protein
MVQNLVETSEALRPKPHRCTFGTYGVSDPNALHGHGTEFVPSTHNYAVIAKAYEKYNNNNSCFNNKSLSDNRPITNFYSAKAHGIEAVHKKTAYINDLET